MVLKGGNNDLVTLTDECLAKAEREHVNRLGGTAGEKNLGRCRSAYELRQSGTRLFVFGGSKLAEVMRATMDIRIPGGISLGNSVNNDLRLLRSGGVIEIHERSVVYLSGKYGEV